ncbi:PREDICTED: vomeronasal type-2 receptor 116-like [Chinchilla lanigera]|uniref:vomeronasal type-2 receptor 116-like n=1 Tax=Chinchilla lanigera TaxID=34839 RepID=UPI00069702FC|nr:PREDICTED: vomeronasal type-2 receptor 116-like [Chinchilla lanigera]
MGTNPPYIDTDAHSEHGHIIIVCNKGSLTAFYCVLGYLGTLALLSFTVAFLARNLPDTFNEAKFLTFSMLVFCRLQTSDVQPRGATVANFSRDVEQLPALVCTFDNEACLHRRSTSVRKDGDVVIGIFFSLYFYIYYTGIFAIKPTKEFYITPLMPNNYQNYLVFTFAIEEINRNPHLLPNISLGYEFHTFIYSHWRILENSFILLTGQQEIPNYTCRRESKCAAVLTEMSWGTSDQIGPLLELYRFPQVTFGSFDPVLTDSGQYPSLYQVAPKDTHLALGMVSLMLHFHWTWVGLLITEGHKGLQFLSDIRAEMDRNRVCAAFVKMVSTVAVSYLSATKKHDILTADTSSVNVVVVYYDTDSTHGVNYNIVQNLVTWKVWVTNSQWHADLSGRDFILDPFHGTLVFSHHRKEISGFKNFVQAVTPFKYPEDTYLIIYWSKNFHCSFSETDCSLKNCTPNASVAWLPPNRFDAVMTDRSYNIYNAVYAVAHALHAMLSEEVQRPPMRNRQVRMFPPWQLHRFLKNIQFNNPAGDQVNLDDRRMPDSEYDILNFWNFPEGLRQKVKLGTFCSHAPHGQKMILSEDMIEWATEITETPRSVCSESCSPGFRKSPQEGKAACCFDCTPCADNEIANDTDMNHCVTCPDHQYANTEKNRCLQKAVTFLAYEDPLGKALAGTTLSLAVLTAAVLGLFVKHRHTPIVKANNRALSYTLLISLTCCFLCSLLFIGRPSTATCILQQTTFGVVFTFAVAFLARNLPDTFNEAKFLTFSMLVFCSVWVTFLPVYHSTKGKVMVAMEVFSILASSAGLLGCIFVPKCYIILLREGRNSTSDVEPRGTRIAHFSRDTEQAVVTGAGVSERPPECEAMSR